MIDKRACIMHTDIPTLGLPMNLFGTKFQNQLLPKRRHNVYHTSQSQNPKLADNDHAIFSGFLL